MVSSIFNEIDIFEIKTESSLHSGVNVSEKTCKILEITLQKYPIEKKQNTQISNSQNF